MPPKKSTKRKSSSAAATRPKKVMKKAHVDESGDVVLEPGPVSQAGPSVTNVEQTINCPPTTTEKADDISAAEGLPKYTGQFDVYSAALPFLASTFMPSGTTQPQYEALFTKILEYQAKPDFTARMVLDQDKNGVTGKFESMAFLDPMSDEHIDSQLNIQASKGPVEITVPIDEATHKDGEGTFQDAFSCSLQMAHPRRTNMLSGNGRLWMRRAWTSQSRNHELFEGYAMVSFKHGALLRRKHFGGSTDYPFTFWAVRARRDAEGKEIGLEEEDDSADARPGSCGHNEPCGRYWSPYSHYGGFGGHFDSPSGDEDSASGDSDSSEYGF